MYNVDIKLADFRLNYFSKSKIKNQ